MRKLLAAAATAAAAAAMTVGAALPAQASTPQSYIGSSPHTQAGLLNPCGYYVDDNGEAWYHHCGDTFITIKVIPGFVGSTYETCVPGWGTIDLGSHWRATFAYYENVWCTV